MKEYILVLFSTIVWGITFVSTKMLLNAGLSAAEIAILRFIIAYVCLLCISRPPFFARSMKEEMLFVLAGIFGGSLYFLTENLALTYSLASNVSIILAAAPLFTMMASHLLLKGERLSLRLFLTSLLIFIGVGMVIFNGSVVLKLSPIGDFLALLAAISWALYVVIIKKLGDRYATVLITRKVFFYGALTLLPFFCITPFRASSKLLLQPHIMGHLLFLAIVASFMCFIAWNYVTKRWGAMRMSNYIYIVPVVSLLAAAIFLKETITPLAILGLLFVIGGLALNAHLQKKKKAVGSSKDGRA